MMKLKKLLNLLKILIYIQMIKSDDESWIEEIDGKFQE